MNDLTNEELTELYLFMEAMLVPYFRGSEFATTYQMVQLVSAFKKVGAVLKGQRTKTLHEMKDFKR